MLCLSRYAKEIVVIGEGENQVILTIREIRSDKVLLGFEADKKVVIHRGEVYYAIQRKKEQEQAE